jgi:BASS family bile acid:Na+ symporter
MNPQQIVVLTLQVSIILTVIGFGLEATSDDLLYALRRPRLLARSLTAMFVIMPLFAIPLTTIFHFQRAVAIALVALSISPVPPLLPRKVTKAGGLAPFGIGLMVTAASLSVVFIPLAIEIIGQVFHRPFAMGPGAVAKLIGMTIFLPLAIGMIFKRVAPGIAARIAKPASLVATALLILGLIAILVFAAPKMLSIIGSGTLAALIAFIVVGLTVGHFLGGPQPDERVTLALCTACRHPGLVLAMAAANVPEEQNVVSAVLLYLILSALLTVPYISWQRRKVNQQPVAVAQAPKS